MLTIGVSSRALFDLTESHELFEQEGIAAYRNHQLEKEHEPPAGGAAFGLVRKLLRLNGDGSSGDDRAIEVVLVSRNSPELGVRALNAIEHYGLDINRFAFSSGAPTSPYLKAFGVDLYLSTDAGSVRASLENGVAAAMVFGGRGPGSLVDGPLRVAFDGDAVLFSDQSEQIYKRHGLAAFSDNEVRLARTPLDPGPFKRFLEGLHDLQKRYEADRCPIRTALVTARGAPAHARVLHTLRAWGIRVDEALFLGGLTKGPFLEAFGADIFFDDQMTHCQSASAFVATGHVPHGIANRFLPGPPQPPGELVLDATNEHPQHSRPAADSELRDQSRVRK